jgi:hypothetical protein
LLSRFAREWQCAVGTKTAGAVDHIDSESPFGWLFHLRDTSEGLACAF